jgi:hypothetical protein
MNMKLIDKNCLLAFHWWSKLINDGIQPFGLKVS